MQKETYDLKRRNTFLPTGLVPLIIEIKNGTQYSNGITGKPDSLKSWIADLKSEINGSRQSRIFLGP